MNKPLIEVLDSSILAEYGNCDRLMEILEHEPIQERLSARKAYERHMA